MLERSVFILLVEEKFVMVLDAFKVTDRRHLSK